MWIYLHQSLCFHILIGENQLLFNGKKDCSSNPLGAPLAHHYIFFPVWKAMPNAPGFKRFSRLSLWDADRSHLVTISKGCLPFSSKAKWAQHWIYIYIYQLHKLLHFSWVACPNHQLLGIHKFIKFLGCLCGVGEPQYVFQTPNVFCYKKNTRFSSLAAPSYVLSRKKQLGFFHLWWQIFQWFIQFSGFAISSCPPYQTSQKQVEGALTMMDGGNSDKFHHSRFKGWPNGGNVSLVAMICPKAGSLEIWEPQRLSGSLDTWSSFPSSSEHLSARPLEANHSKFSKAITFCWGAWFFGLKEGKGGKWCENRNMCRVGWMALEKQDILTAHLYKSKRSWNAWMKWYWKSKRLVWRKNCNELAGNLRQIHQFHGWSWGPNKKVSCQTSVGNHTLFNLKTPARTEQDFLPQIWPFCLANFWSCKPTLT